MDFSNINYLAVFVSALASFVIGSLWYSPILFGKSWQNALGLSEDDLKGANMFLIFGTSFVLMFIMALGLALFSQGHTNSESTWLGGLSNGLFVALFFVSTSYGVNMLYQRKPFKLWAIDAGYQIVLLGVMGMIIGAW
ncbi:MAG TPA: DUF1761 domain-containing protein [Bacteroidales bacterium]|nr:DUF1761 domain-containing protein [Bacteroidales bacterium]